MSTTATLLLVIMVAVFVSLIISLLIVRRARGRAAASVAALGTPLRTTAATSLGTTAETAKPMRGTGTLVLTGEEVAFAQWMPSQLLRIPRAAIVRTDTTREHAGRTMKSDLLRITWSSPAGEQSIAVFVRELDPWLHDLGGRRSAEA